MSMRYPGGVISATADTPTSTSASGVWNLEDQMQAQAAGNWPAPFAVRNSLRIRKSASAYLNRTPASASNRKTWTWSAWVKRGALDGSYQSLLECWNGNNDNQCFNISWTNANEIMLGAYSVLWRVSTPVYRDPSAWYHVVVAVDTTQSTAANRLKIYINNSQVTSFGTSNDPALNADLAINQAAAHYLGSGNSRSYSDGYLAEVNFVDGQALTPSSFGTTDPTTGVWTYQKYSGSYGTNGYYLPFSDTSALTTSSNAGLGKDFSGNGNYWATNNISITAGSTYDAMTDVPAPLSATVANYCVWNYVNKPSGIAITDGNLTAQATGNTNNNNLQGTFSVSSGKWYFENTVTQSGANQSLWGFINQGTSNLANPGSAYGIVCGCVGSAYATMSGSTVANAIGTTFTTGDVGMVAIDVDAGKLWFGKNGTWLGSGSPNPATATAPNITFTANTPITPTWQGYETTNAGSTNFGQRPFAYTAPTGFVALNTNNLSTPTILKGNQYFTPVLYTGTGASNSVNVGFQPDFTWSKARSQAYTNYLFDAVRGGNKYLISQGNDAQYTGDTAFTSNGFSMSSDINASGVTYVAWNWKANGAGSTNTAGSITATVSANPTAGFSIIRFAGTGSAATVGHGLGATPACVIQKSIGVGNWNVWFTGFGANNYLRLNSNVSTQSSAGNWGSGTFNSTVYSTATGDADNIAYAFTPIAGFSAMGTYTGNGNSDGPFIYTGFRPAYTIIKCTSNQGEWTIHDDQRPTYNQSSQYLFADVSDSEYNNVYNNIDYLANGFKCRGTTGTNQNGSGYTYVYMAFAENPFKYALAR